MGGGSWYSPRPPGPVNAEERSVHELGHQRSYRCARGTVDDIVGRSFAVECGILVRWISADADVVAADIFVAVVGRSGPESAAAGTLGSERNRQHVTAAAIGSRTAALRGGPVSSRRAAVG